MSSIQVTRGSVLYLQKSAHKVDCSNGPDGSVNTGRSRTNTMARGLQSKGRFR